jgi:hypothetical protein
MGTKALNMDVDVDKIRIGSVRLFVGEVATVFDSAEAFDVDTPPTGWRDLGATAEDTVLEATKEIFKLKTGQLRTTKYEAVIGMEGRLTATLEEFDAEAVADAMGSARPFNVLRAAPTGSGIQTVTNAKTIILAAGQGSNFAVGDRVAVALAASLATTNNVGKIETINTDTITLEANLRTLPTDAMKVQKVNSRKNAIGTTVIQKWTLLAVHDLVGGAQYVYHFPEVSAIESGFRPALHEGRENVKIPIVFGAYGVIDTDFGDTVVAAQYEFEA